DRRCNQILQTARGRYHSRVYPPSVSNSSFHALPDKSLSPDPNRLESSICQNHTLALVANDHSFALRRSSRHHNQVGFPQCAWLQYIRHLPNVYPVTTPM